MALKFKDRTENPRKKILVYGLDGTGKSTFAYNYCEENGLNPVVIDVDDTNFTPSPILDLDFGNDITTYNNIKKAVEEIGKTDEFDTIILDGVTSLLEMLVSKARGMAKYSDRAMRWNDILFKLDNTKKNIIFIGQIDMEMMFTEDYQPSKAVIKVNSLVNEKYRCFIDEKGNYDVEVKKFRTLEQIESETGTKIQHQEGKIVPQKVVDDRAENVMDNAEEIAHSIISELPQRNMLMAKLKVKELLDTRVIPEEECPKILDEIKKVLG